MSSFFPCESRRPYFPARCGSGSSICTGKGGVNTESRPRRGVTWIEVNLRGMLIWQTFYANGRLRVEHKNRRGDGVFNTRLPFGRSFPHMVFPCCSSLRRISLTGRPRGEIIAREDHEVQLHGRKRRGANFSPCLDRLRLETEAVPRLRPF